jgi:hypothetical protein
MDRPGAGGAGLRAVVAKGSTSGAVLTCEVKCSELRRARLRNCLKSRFGNVWTMNWASLGGGYEPKKRLLGGSPNHTVSESGTFQTVSLGSEVNSFRPVPRPANHSSAG